MNDRQADEVERTERRIRSTLAKSLRDFGYPSCNQSNVLTDLIYRAFAKSQLQDIVSNPRLASTVAGSVCRRFLANIEALDKADAT